MNQVPAHILARQKRDLVGAALGGINAGSPAHISIAGNRFTLVDDAGNEKPVQTLNLDVCVIDANPSVSKIYFDPSKPFVPGGDNSNPPICWSDNGIGASKFAAQPQHTTCQICPHNAWGSAKSKATGADTKACNDVKKVAVLVPGIEMVFLLRIPPASLKRWGKHCQTLAGHGVDLPDAVTRITFASQGILDFAPVGYVDEATAVLTEKVWAGKGTEQLVGKNDIPWTGQADAQKLEYARTALLRPTSPTAELTTSPPAPTPAAMAPPPQPFGGPANQSGPFRGSPTPGPVADPFGAPAANHPPIAAGSPFGGTAGVTTAPSPSEPKARKPRAPKAAPVADDGIPPFLQRNAQNESPAPTAPPPNTFGMDPSPAAPDAGIAAALDAAFRLPT
jgi:hypothetical protein